MSTSLYLMNRKGLAVLQAVVERFGPAAVNRVVGAPDPAVRRDYRAEIREVAVSAGIPYFERAGNPPPPGDAPALAVGWRWLIQSAPRLVVIHDSLLPRYRGFAPVVSCLVNGEPLIGATALLAADGYDEGDIVAQASVGVQYPITIGHAIELLSDVYEKLALDIVGRIVDGAPLTGTPQDHSQATYSLWRDDDDYRIDWSEPAARIRRLVDAVGDPYVGASTLVDGRLARVIAAQERGDVRVENRTPGKVIFMEQGKPVVVCGEGLLCIEALVDDETGAALLPLKKFRVRFS
jgi:methionyl-tRNA formyltransferase